MKEEKKGSRILRVERPYFAPYGNAVICRGVILLNGSFGGDKSSAGKEINLVMPRICKSLVVMEDDPNLLLSSAVRSHNNK